MIGKWLLLVVVVLVASKVNAAERIVGLVEIPVFHGGNYEEIMKHPKGSVTLFNEPSGKASVAAVVEEFAQLETREHGYEMASAVFYELRHTSDSGVWFKVRYRMGNAYSFGWLKGADAGQIRRYGQLVHGGFSYFTESWDKRVFQLPERSSPSTRYDELGERQSVAVADVRYSGKDPMDLWFLVVIRKGNICGDPGGDPGNDGTTIITTGWVPAYSNDGSVTVWYYSRGC